MKSMNCRQISPTIIFEDNQGTIAISGNERITQRTSHIEVRHFFIRECVENLELRVPFVSTIDNMADFFTKPLPPKTFYRMRNAIMNVPAHTMDN